MAVGTHSASAGASDDVPVDRLYRLSDDQYRRMIDAGVLDADAVEQRRGYLPQTCQLVGLPDQLFG